jgi:dihydroorotate dehydrogenase electron transfer subunit
MADKPGRNFRALVVDNSAVNAADRVLTFRQPEDTPRPRAGQFYMVDAGTPIDPLLKRPFCFFRRTPEGIQLLYRIRGRGTELIAGLKAGDTVDIIGPLGRAWPAAGDKKPLVVAGGVAIASVFPLIEGMKGRAVVIYGAKDKEELVMVDELKAISGELHISTDNGTLGTRGTVIDVLNGLSPGDDTVLYSCGPRPMTSAVVRYAKSKGIKGYVSLEEFMACGIGACMGCVCETMKGYKRVCKEGPVFRLEDVII